MASTLGTFVGGTSYLEEGKQRFTFDVLDLDTDEVQRIPLDFLAHGFAVKPGAPQVAAVFEKRGPGAALLDLRAMKLVSKIRGKASRAYYGHGVYDREGENLYVVETDLDTHRGVVSVRETTTYKEIDAFPTHGDNPHDCVAIDDGKVLVFTNGGGRIGEGEPSVTYVEVATRKLLEKVTFTDPKVNAGHLVIGRDGSLVVVSAPRDGLPEHTSAGAIHLRSGKRKPERMRAPKVTARIVGESLSACLHEPSGVVGVTHPHGGIVAFWSMKSHKLVAFHEAEAPRGIALSRDGSTWVVAFGKHASIRLLDVHTFEPHDRTYGTTRLSGSHVFPYEPVTSP